MDVVRTIWAILLPSERRRAATVFAVIVLSTLLEMASIGMIVPALAILSGEPTAAPAFIRPWIDWFGSPSPARILLLLATLVAVYAAKSLVLLVAAYHEAEFAADVQTSTSQRLCSAFLARPWTFHLERNSSNLVHAITEAQQFAPACVLVCQILSEWLVLTGLLAMLACIEPFGTLVVAGTLGSAFWVFHRLVRPRGRVWAAARRHHMQRFMQQVSEALAGVREVRLRGCERPFLDRFHEHTSRCARLGARHALLEKVPRSWFELLAVVALFLLAAAMVGQGRPVHALLPMLGLFATVAFRVLPAINYASLAMQRLRQVEPMLEAVRDHLADAPAIPADAAGTRRDFREAIRLERVSYRYPGGHAPVLHDIDLVVPHGSSVGIVGGSGAGKTTLVDLLLGLLEPTSGRVTVDGVDTRDDLRGWQRIVGYVPQAVAVSDDTIRRNVAFGVPDADIDDSAVRRALAAARLEDFVAGLPEGLDTSLGESGKRLSGGEVQRIGIARALYHDPQVLVLDEATSALDVETERHVMAAVESLHGVKTIIIVAHRLSTVAACDALHRLEAGRVVRSGSFAEVTAS